MSAREIYEKNIRQLPAIDRLRLASIILDELAKSAPEALDISYEWTDDDVADFSKATWNYADKSLDGEEPGA